MSEVPPASTVLFVGLPSIGGIKSLGWSEIDGANPAEYNVAVVDCTSLVNFIDIAINCDKRIVLNVSRLTSSNY